MFFSYSKKLHAVVLVFLVSQQPIVASERTFFETPIGISTGILAAAGTIGIGIGIWACSKIEDYQDRNHLDELERALVIAYSQFSEDTDTVIRRMYALEDAVVRVLSNVDWTHPHTVTEAIASLRQMDIQEAPQFDQEQGYLHRVVKKWKHKVGYELYYNRAAEAQEKLDVIRARVGRISETLAHYNQFVRIYTQLLPIFSRNAASLAWFNQGTFVVSSGAAEQRYPYLSYKRSLKRDLCELEEILGKRAETVSCRALLDIARGWHKGLSSYYHVFVLSDQYRDDVYRYEQEVYEKQKLELQRRELAALEYQNRLKEQKLVLEASKQAPVTIVNVYPKNPNNHES